jgi:membrane-bound lytic murein transglycosylase D
VLVESGGRNTALSSKGALGLWQFMPETARRYGLAVTPGLDERVDIVKSTRAAAHYLRDLYARFGDWSLAFAAYNAGEQKVQHALQRGGGDFGSMSRNRQLPLETRNYVPAVLSAVHLLGGVLSRLDRPMQGSSKSQITYAASALSN